MGLLGSLVNLAPHGFGILIGLDHRLVSSLPQFARRRICIPPILRVGFRRATRSQCHQSGQQDSSGAFWAEGYLTGYGPK